MVRALTKRIDTYPTIGIILRDKPNQSYVSRGMSLNDAPSDLPHDMLGFEPLQPFIQQQIVDVVVITLRQKPLGSVNFRLRILK
jgi:hypothetical protein